MVRLAHVGAWIVVCLLFAGGALARSHDEWCEDLLPPEARASLQSQFPDLYPQKVSDLSTEYQQAWIKEHPNECPGIAEGHFQSRSKMSYAVVLVGSRGALSGSKLVVMTQNASGAWKTLKLEEETISYHYEAVSKAPGKNAALDRIRFKELDGGATVFSWNGARFHKMAAK